MVCLNQKFNETCHENLREKFAFEKISFLNDNQSLNLFTSGLLSDIKLRKLSYFFIKTTQRN